MKHLAMTVSKVKLRYVNSAILTVTAREHLAVHRSARVDFGLGRTRGCWTWILMAMKRRSYALMGPSSTDCLTPYPVSLRPAVEVTMFWSFVLEIQ